MIKTLEVERVNHHISDFDDEELWEFHKGEANYYQPNGCELLDLSEEQIKDVNSWKTYYSAHSITDYYITIHENKVSVYNGKLGTYKWYDYCSLENHYFFWKINGNFYVQKLDYICTYRDFKWMFMEIDVDKFKFLGTWDKVLEYYEINIKKGSEIGKKL